MGKEGIIAEHPTLKLKYSDPDMAKTAADLKQALTFQQLHDRHASDCQHDDIRSKNEIKDGGVRSVNGQT